MFLGLHSVVHICWHCIKQHPGCVFTRLKSCAHLSSWGFLSGGQFAARPSYPGHTTSWHLPHSSSSHETPGPEQGETGAANFLQRPAQPIVRQLVTSDWSPKSSQASYWLKLAHKFAKCERIHRRRVGDKMLPRRHTHWSPHAALATRHRKCPPEGWVAGWRQ